jgi:two-component system response regulator NreC
MEVVVLDAVGAPLFRIELERVSPLVQLAPDGDGGYVLRDPEAGSRIGRVEWFAATPPGDALTGREQEVLRMLVTGHTNAEVAARLTISVRTVEMHRAHIRRKLGLGSRAELVRWAAAMRLLP